VKQAEQKMIGTAALDTLVQDKNSSESLLERYRIMLIGLANHGKTTMARTAEEDPSKLRWILLDNDGLLPVPDVDYYDLSNVPVEQTEQAARVAIKRAHEELSSGKKNTVVFDSVSTYMALIEAQVKADYAGEKFGYWDAVLAAGMRTFAQLRALPGNLIVTSHVTAVHVLETKNKQVQAAQENKLAAEGLKEGDKKLDISGKTGRFYRNNFGNIWPVYATGTSPNQEFACYPFGHLGIEGKCKFPMLSKKESPNLQQIFAKVRAG
jgi:hypothetical protein